jgi:hypothetical protein
VRTLTQIMNWLLQPFCLLIQLILADDGGSRSLWNVGTYLPNYQELYSKRQIQFPFALAIYQTTKSSTPKDNFSSLLS